MPMEEEKPVEELTEGQTTLLRAAQKSFMMRQTMSEILKSLPGPRGKDSLICTPDTGVFTYHLNRHGGNWHTLILSPEALQDAQQLAGDQVTVFDGTTLPFEDGQFETVIIVGVLERVHDDHNFIMQCHRVLAPDGRLLLNAPNDKELSLIRPIRSMLGLTPQRLNLIRSGYSEKDLFTLLKDGFDVHSMYTYSRFFVQLLNSLVQASIAGSNIHHRVPVYHSRLFSMFSFAYFLDCLIFFLRGYRMVASAKRRAWRPRKTPILNDGRSLTEAVLSAIQN